MEKLRLNTVNEIPQDAFFKPDINWAKSPIRHFFVVSNNDGVLHYHAISPRKAEILMMVAENPDIKTREIAYELGLKFVTVSQHLIELYREFGIEGHSYHKKRQLVKHLRTSQAIVSETATGIEKLISSGIRVVYEGLRYNFPDRPKQIVVGDHMAFEYISPSEMNRNIRALADEINLGEYEAILVNLKGGDYLFKKLMQIKISRKSPVYIEYRRPENGFGAGIVKPIPKNLIGKRCLYIDDLYISGGTAEEVMDGLSPDSTAVFVAIKDGLDGQLKIKSNLMFAVRIDPDAWMGGLGGCGMDLERGTPDENIIRNYGGIITKCPPLKNSQETS